MQYLFFYRLVLDSFPLADFFLKNSSILFTAIFVSIFSYRSRFYFRLTPVYLFNSFTLVLRLHIFPRQFLSPDDPRNLFSLTQFGLSLVLPHRCSSMFFLRCFSLFPFKYSLSPFCSPSATRSFVRFRKHDCTDSCCKCTCHDFLVEYVHTRTYVRACKAYTLETFETHTIAEGSSMLGNSMDYAANF